MIYTVTFNPAIDYVVRVNGAFETGVINRTESESFQYGGKGINVSCVLNALGIQSVALGFAAGYTGEWLKKGLADIGIKTDLIDVEQGSTRINVKIKAGEETEINGAGPIITSADLQKLYAKLDALQSGDVLVLAGSIPKCLDANEYKKIMQRLDKRRIDIVVDAEKNLLLNVLEYKPFLIKPNNHELGDMFGKTLETDSEIINCAKILQQMGAKNVLVSMADKGAILIDENETVHKIGAAKGTVVNSVGAGDSMVAGFIAGYAGTNDYDYALRLGTAAGAATAFKTDLCTKADVDAILNVL